MSSRRTFYGRINDINTLTSIDIQGLYFCSCWHPLSNLVIDLFWVQDKCPSACHGASLRKPFRQVTGAPKNQDSHQNCCPEASSTCIKLVCFFWIQCPESEGLANWLTASWKIPGHHKQITQLKLDNLASPAQIQHLDSQFPVHLTRTRAHWGIQRHLA